MYANKFCDAGQVPIFRYFEAWVRHVRGPIFFFLKETKKSGLIQNVWHSNGDKTDKAESNGNMYL